MAKETVKILKRSESEVRKALNNAGAVIDKTDHLENDILIIHFSIDTDPQELLTTMRSEIYGVK